MLFFLPLLALKSSLLESVYDWLDDMRNQVLITRVIAIVALCYVTYTVVRIIIYVVVVVGRWVVKRFWV